MTYDELHAFFSYIATLPLGMPLLPSDLFNFDRVRQSFPQAVLER